MYSCSMLAITKNTSKKAKVGRDREAESRMEKDISFIRHESGWCKLVRDLDPFVTFSKAWL